MHIFEIQIISTDKFLIVKKCEYSKRAMANNLWYITNWKIKKRTSYDEPNLNGTAKLYWDCYYIKIF